MKRKRFGTTLAMTILTVFALSANAQTKASDKVQKIQNNALTAPQTNMRLNIEECQRLARENYPLLKRYDLIKQTTDFTVSNLNKGYLPQVALNAQATYQSDVMALPDMLNNMLAGNGNNAKGLAKDQYKVAIDVNQVIYDGGSISSRKETARLEGEVRNRQTDTELYALRDRVNNLFFGILLTDNRLLLNEDLQRLLKDNCRKLETMLKGGIAMQCDVDAVKAEYLNACQQHTELEATRESFRKMLSIFIGRDVNTELEKPDAIQPASNEVRRPELATFAAQADHTKARMKMIDAGIRPTLSMFAQGFYGYPGLNTFEDMFSRDWSLNGIVGVRLSWNIGNLYTHKNEKRKLTTAMDEIENSREMFLFNNALQSTEDRAAIERYQKMMAQDDEIITLRTAVRKAAEAKLEHGTISVNDLLQEITKENSAKIEHSIHETEMLKNIYELKNTLGDKEF